MATRSIVKFGQTLRTIEKNIGNLRKVGSKADLRRELVNIAEDYRDTMQRTTPRSNREHPRDRAEKSPPFTRSSADQLPGAPDAGSLAKSWVVRRSIDTGSRRLSRVQDVGPIGNADQTVGVGVVNTDERLKKFLKQGADLLDWLDKGTGRRTITPRRRTFMRFYVFRDGFLQLKEAEAVLHPGNNPYDFLEPAVKRARQQLKNLRDKYRRRVAKARLT